MDTRVKTCEAAMLEIMGLGWNVVRACVCLRARLRERARAFIDGALVVAERGRERKRVAPVKGRRGGGAVAREVGQLVGGGGGEAPDEAGGGAPRQLAAG